MAYDPTKYDPQKAHEYYEKRKQLKERTSTKGLSKDNKIMAAYIKEQLKEKMKAQKEELKKQIKQQKEKLKEQLKKDIKKVQDKLKKLGSMASPREKEKLKNEIKKIRAKATEERKKITEGAKEAGQKLRDEMNA